MQSACPLALEFPVRPARPLLLTTLAATAAVSLFPLAGASADDGGRRLSTTLLGANEGAPSR